MEIAVMMSPSDNPFSAQPGIESADAWVQQANEFLTMWRERDLFPDSLAHQDLQVLHNTVPVREFAKGLPEVLKLLCGDRVRWILFAHDSRSPKRCWLAIVYEDGRIYAEVEFNYYREADQHLADEDGMWLESAGWANLDPAQRLNWSRVPSTAPEAATEAAQNAVDVIREAFHLEDLDLVGLRMFPSKDQGESPANPDLGG